MDHPPPPPEPRIGRVSTTWLFCGLRQVTEGQKPRVGGTESGCAEKVWELRLQHGESADGKQGEQRCRKSQTDVEAEDMVQWLLKAK